MKTKFLENWKVVLVLAALPLVAASIQTPGSVSTAVAAEDFDDDNGSVPIDPVIGLDPNQSLLNPTNGPGAAGTTNTTLFASDLTTSFNMKPSAPTLPDLKLTGGTAALVKLAQSGAGEDIMLSFVTNTPARFGLGPDEIIYLNDLGVSGAVVTAMLQHDSALNGSTTANIAAAMPVTEPEPMTEPAQPVTWIDTATTTTPDYVDYGGYPAVDYNVPQQDTSYFYDSLAPYGSWVPVAGYGLCWQPTVYVRNPAWRPYLDRGRWLYSDCGWYWQSDYSWGWAAFHYGRWYCDTARGWVWCPDRVWGPAWVNWRQSGDYCGWAPLPPAARFHPGVGFTFQNRNVAASFGFGLGSGLYNFIPVARMTDYSPYRYRVTGAQATRVFGQATVVNNVTVQNNRVFNRGVNPASVETAAHIPVRRAVIQETPNRASHGPLADRIEKRGDTLTILRPTLPGTERNSATTAQRSRAESPRDTTPAILVPTVNTAGSTVAAPKPTVPVGRTVTSSATPGTTDTRPRVEVFHRSDAPPTTPPAAKPAPDSTARVTSSSATPGTTDRRPRVETFVRTDTQPATPPILVPNTSVATTPAGQGTTASANPPNSIILKGPGSGRPNNGSATETTPPNSIVLKGPGAGRANNNNAVTTPPRSTAQEIYRADKSFTVQVPRSSIETPQPAQTYTAPAYGNANGNAYGRSSAPNQSLNRSTSDSSATANNSSAYGQGQGTAAGGNGNGNAYGGGMNRNFGNSSPSQGATHSAPAQSQAPILVPSRSTGGGQSAPAYSAPAYNPPAPRSAPAQAPIYVPSRPAPAPAPAPAPVPAPSQSQSSSRSSDSSGSSGSQSQRGGR